MVINLHRLRCSTISLGWDMLVSKLLDGVMVVEQDASRRAFRPKFLHRIMLAWIFRYFASLPMPVLAKWQKSLIAEVMAEGVLVPVPNRDSDVIIGMVENATASPVEGKPIAPVADWEYVTRRPTGDRISA